VCCGGNRGKNPCTECDLEPRKTFDFGFIYSEKCKSRLLQELDGVTLIHMDYLSQLTDETLENRKKHTFLQL
jgi:hypothetical protein